MKTYQTRARTGRDGTLHLQLACGVADAEIDVIVIMEPAAGNGAKPGMDRDQWHRFLAETAGSVQDPDFIRHPQGEFESRATFE